MSHQATGHVKPSKLARLIQSIKNSPYPWHYTIRWPLYFHFPSTRNHDRINPLPAENTLSQSIDLPSTRIIFGGDIMLQNGDSIPELCPQLKQLIGSADLFVANCEAPVGAHSCSSQSRYDFLYHMPKEFLEGIIDQLPIDRHQILLSAANNHSGDMGVMAFSESLKLMKSLGVSVLGENAGSNQIHALEINGISLGFCAWTHWQNCPVFDSNDQLLTEQHIIESDIVKTKKDTDVDFLIGMPHWGYEFQHYPDKKTRKQGAYFLENGFDMLMGSHPHVLQPLEYHNNKLCVYSLGNFCGPGKAYPIKIITLLEITIAKGKQNTDIHHYKLHFFFQQNVNDSVRISDLSELDEHIKEQALGRIEELT